MIIEKFKDAAIIALTVLAVYLTGQLWFDEISNRNFFYMISSIFYSNETPITDERAVISTPYRIITNYGNSSYDIAYSNLSQTAQKTDCDDVLSNLMRYGDYAGARELDWETVLRNRSYIYNYKLAIPSALFVMNFPQSNNILTSRVRNFNYIVIIPSRSYSESVRVFFIDEQNAQYYEYSLDRNASALNQRMLANIQTLQDSQKKFLYSSSKQSGLDAFNSNSFIPEVSQYGLTYDKIAFENPYKVNDELLLNSLEKKMYVFFDNPALMVPSLTNNTIYTFSDESTIVKYYTYDVVEYSSYKVVDRRNPSTFIGDFNAAVDFIVRDREVRNDYFLSDYKEEGGRHIFYFDYAINDIPMILSADCMYETGLEHPIEITVEHGWVTKYRKLAYNYHTAEGAASLATIGYIDFISMSIDEADLQFDQVQLSDIMLCYRIDRRNLASLHWFIRFNGRSITLSAGM